MKRYPLATLVKLREHRTEAARQQVLQRQKAAREKRDDCLRIEGEIIALDFERNQQRRRLLDPPPDGMPLPVALAQRESHIDLLQTQIEAARQRLSKAQEILREAELALQKARDEFFKTKSREDALKKRKDMWREEQHSIELRQEENAAAELLQSRHAQKALH